jgi:hypothetical protein
MFRLESEVEKMRQWFGPADVRQNRDLKYGSMFSSALHCPHVYQDVYLL